MATTTPNIGLTLPDGTENINRSVINGNNTLIDTAVGALNSNLIQVRTVNVSSMSLNPTDYTDTTGVLNSAFTNGANIFWLFNNQANLIFPICIKSWDDSTHVVLRVFNGSSQTLSNASASYKIFGIKA